MSCAPNERLLQTLRVHVPGATDAMIELELFNVVDEFFRRTSAWLYTQDIELQENSLDYALALPADSTVVRLMRVSHNGVPVPSTAGTAAVISSLGRLSPEESFPDGDASFAPAAVDLTGGLFTYAVYRPEVVTLTAVPDEQGRQHPMQVISALSVARSCLDKGCGGWPMDEWMHNMFFEDWLNGALARLYGMPSKPWSSEKHAVIHGKKFRNNMAFRKQEALRGFTYGVPAWRFPLFA